MRRARIPAVPWPDWARTHRTLAEVSRTKALLAKIATGEPLLAIERHELNLLMDKARRNNPPDDAERNREYPA